jgi:hypothetical protein
MLPKFLYRGDKKGNATMPEKYNYGLYTKLLQRGDPAYISRKGIYQSVKNHVLPKSEEELQFYLRSHFLSFSESKEIAKWYASDKDIDEDCEAKEYPEKRYIFTFDFSRVQAKQFRKNIYDIPYSCFNSSCEICQSRKDSHHLLILDVFSILKENPTYLTNEQALASAKRDKEWLVLPFDYRADLYGCEGTIPCSNIWSVEHFGYYHDDSVTFF